MKLVKFILKNTFFFLEKTINSPFYGGSQAKREQFNFDFLE